MREGGNVRRCHTVPHQGEYTNGKHSYDAVNLLLVLHPDPSVNLIKAVLWHDCAERFVGDMPSVVGKYNPELYKQYLVTEEKVQQLTELELPKLTPEEANWLLAVDKLELWMWCQDQFFFGNLHIDAMRISLMHWFEAYGHQLPEPVLEFFNAYRWKRLSNNPEER